MIEVARLTANGELKVTGSLNTRLPSSTGLIAHYPFDGSELGYSTERIMPYENWVVGTSGSQPFFPQNGETACNSIVMGEDPFGETIPLWQTLGNDITSDADGGWDSNYFPVISTKMYRFSVWIKREVLGNGTYYFGCHGSPSAVLNRSDGASNSNPYFYATSGNGILNDWFLLVGHVWPEGSGTGTAHVDSGLYNKYGKKITSFSDFVWATATTTANHRTYLYYSTDATAKQLWCYPKVEIVDGSEPTILQMTQGHIHSLRPIINITTTKQFDGISVDQPTVNLLGPITPSWYNWGDINGYTESYTNSYGNPGVHLLVNSITSGGVEWYNTGGQRTAIPSTVYTISAKIKCIGANPDTNAFYLRQYRANGSEISQTGQFVFANQYELEDGWKKAYSTFTTHSECVNLLVHGYCYGVKQIWIEDVQCEQKPFPTSFVSGTRILDGQLAIVNPVKTGNYTINFKSRQWTKVGTSYNYHTVLCMGDYYSLNSWTIMDIAGSTVAGNLGFIRRGNAGEWAWSSGTFTNSSTWNNENTFTVVRDATNYKIYSNGVYKGMINHLSTTMQDLIWVGSRNGGGCGYSSTIRDLSIYNYAMTDEEVNKLVAKKSNLMQNGDINTVNIDTDNISGWTKVFEGISTQACFTTSKLYEELNLFGDSYQFNQLMVVHKYAPHMRTIATTTETAKLKYSLKWYIDWLYTQPNASSPQIKFHGLDDIQDVGFTAASTLFYGYGNSWRVYRYPIYVDRPSEGYLYIGGVGGEIIKADWQAYYSEDDYLSPANSESMAYRESGINKLTIREMQTIQVFIRKTADPEPKLNMQNGLTMQSGISTGEVL